jgi:uncharacterized protein (TIGR00251 family)
MKIEVRVQPRSSREEVVRVSRSALKVYMHEAALEGRANRKLVAMLADYFETKKQNIRIATGLKARNKVVEVNEKTHGG